MLAHQRSLQAEQRESTHDQPSPFYVFTHVPKAGGTSFVDDAPSFAGLASCGRLHCYGDGSKSALQAMGALRATEGCNFAACEGNLSFIVRQLGEGSAEAGRAAQAPETHVFLLRKPHDHVVSMYAHCVARRRWHHYEPIGFEDWVRLAVASPSYEVQSGRETLDRKDAMGKYCSYNPKDPATSRLGGGNLSAALEEVHHAGFVGVLEHYALSLCLFRVTVGAGPLPPACACDDGHSAGADVNVRRAPSACHAAARHPPHAHHPPPHTPAPSHMHPPTHTHLTHPAPLWPPCGRVPADDNHPRRARHPPRRGAGDEASGRLHGPLDGGRRCAVRRSVGALPRRGHGGRAELLARSWRGAARGPQTGRLQV